MPGGRAAAFGGPEGCASEGPQAAWRPIFIQWFIIFIQDFIVFSQ